MNLRFPRSSSGFTLLELLVAITLSSFVLLLAGRYFLTGSVQFGKRVSESDNFRQVYLLDKTMDKVLREPIAACAGGKLTLRGQNIDIEKSILRKFKKLEGVLLWCIEQSEPKQELVPWNLAGQPALIEYSGTLDGRKFSGSVLR